MLLGALVSVRLYINIRLHSLWLADPSNSSNQRQEFSTHTDGYEENCGKKSLFPSLYLECRRNAYIHVYIYKLNVYRMLSNPCSFSYCNFHEQIGKYEDWTV